MYANLKTCEYTVISYNKVLKGYLLCVGAPDSYSSFTLFSQHDQLTSLVWLTRLIGILFLEQNKVSIVRILAYRR